MNPVRTSFFRLVNVTLLLLVATLLNGCVAKHPHIALLDLGTAHVQPKAQEAPLATLPSVYMTDIETPTWLDNRMMFYRLNYANPFAPRAYAKSQWTMPPADLFAQRLKRRLTQTGTTVMPAAQSANNLPLLRLELDEFSQHFQSAHNSTGEVIIRASLYDGSVLRAQKTFMHSTPATTADAQGAASALAAASDAIIQDLRTWLTTLQKKP